MKNIKYWFEKLSNKIETESDSLVFMEPNLQSRQQSGDDDKDYFVNCVFNNKELKLIVKELEKQVEQYPKRAIL